MRDREGAGVEAEAWRTAKSFDLLRVLALSRGTPVPSELLVDLFWPAAGPVRGGTSLRTAVSHVRRVLGTESIVRADHGLLLDAWVDVDAFRAMRARVDAGRVDGGPARIVEAVREAEELYGGDLDVTGSECAWLHEARAELRAERMDLLLDGAEAAGRCADWRQSLAFAQRAAEIEVTDRSTRALMRAWYAMGEAAKPVEEFERLRLRLAEDYGVDPAPQTRALYLEVVGGCHEWPPRETVIGRDTQVAEVVSGAMAWLIDPEGEGGVVWLAGEAGSGRDTVAREAGRALGMTGADHGLALDGRTTIELLPDQGRWSRGLAELLHARARACDQLMLVPVAAIDESEDTRGEAIVAIPPLEPDDFARLLGFVLQGRAAPELQEELYAETRGLPGRACRVTRQRIESGSLTWTTAGVDATKRQRLRTRILPSLASIPLVLLGFTGGEGAVEASARTTELERERNLVVVG
ncbi:BTAD domain-containing putative transcriptional regulator [Nocardioides sp. T5]|uniref:BTAD domain-containing putative transcriptional regulator n=1 Tax=Nocardioides sp. T5 TaxID=3400182 RepID=UPI003A8A7D1D